MTFIFNDNSITYNYTATRNFTQAVVQFPLKIKKTLAIKR